VWGECGEGGGVLRGESRAVVVKTSALKGKGQEGRSGMVLEMGRLWRWEVLGM